MKPQPFLSLKLQPLLLLAVVLGALMVLLAALSSTGPTPSDVSAEGAFQQASDTSGLLAKAGEEGHVLLIVGLRPTTHFVPEGALAGPAAIDQQRNDIAITRQALLDSVAGYNVEAYASWDSVPYVALKVDAKALQQLLASPYVTTIQEDVPVEPLLASATAHIGADATWGAGFGGAGQTVVILDTGIDADHPFYGGRVVSEACWSNAGGAGSGVTLCPNGANSQTGLGSADALTAQCLNGTAELCDHGSHVAGIAAGRDPGGVGYNGIAPEANIIAIQVFTRFNAAGDCAPDPAPCVRTYGSDQLNALNYVNGTLRLNWDIAAANMSLGGGMNTTACDGDALKPSIDNLLSNGIATVISSGNEDWTDALSAPGCISTAVTVGNVFDPSDNVTDNMHAVVDLLAAGRNVDSSVPDDAYGNKSGTSMAAPEVTGAFAMLSAIDGSLGPGDILNLLQNTGVSVTDTRPPNPGGSFAGHVKPRIQLDAAVGNLVPPDVSVTVTPNANVHGWNNTPVTIDWTVTGFGTTLSGDCAGSLHETINFETAGLTRTCTATNGAGSDTETTRLIKTDFTVPTINVAKIPPPNAYGWNNTDVTVDFTCADNLSGVASCPADQTFTDEGRNQPFAGSACDFADNCLSANGLINIDKTPPDTTFTLDPATPNGKNGWYITPVEVCLSPDDPLLSNGDPPSGVRVTRYRLSGGPWQDYGGCFTLGEGHHLVEFYSEDFADNVEDTNAITVLIDWTPPEARVGYNESEHFTDLWGADNLSDVTVSPDDLAVGTHFYLLEDEAGNTLTVELNLHGWGATQEARIFSLQYGADPKLKLPYTHLFRHDNRWPQITEYCWLSGQFSVRTLYRATLDETHIWTWTNAASSSEDLLGLVHLVLATDKGA